MWLLILAIVLLAFSATYTAYQLEFYGRADNISMVLFFAGIIMLFVAVGWWGFAGIVGWLLLLTMERVIWHKRYESYLKRGINPYRTFRHH